MLNTRFRSHALMVCMLGTAALSQGTASLSAQEPSTRISVHIANSDVQLLNYDKISATLAGNPVFHVTGTKTIFEWREKDRAIHRLHADDMKISLPGNRGNGEFSGNIHYTMMQASNSAKLIEGTAERALYNQTDGKQTVPKIDTGVTLLQAHISLFRDGAEIAKLESGKIVANLQDDLVIGTGAVHLSAHLGVQHAELTAEKITWNRHTNTLQASGKAHVSYTGINKNDAVLDADKINIDLKNLAVTLE